MSARVVAQQWVSVDGFAAGTSGEAEIFAAVPDEADQASMQYNLQFLPTVAEVLLGRRTYEAFVRVWPSADLPVATHVNTLPKVVFSRSLDGAPWGDVDAAQVATDAVGHVGRRREEADGTLLVWQVGPSRPVRWQEDAPGTWLFHCHVNDHIDAGMIARFNGASVWRPTMSSLSRSM